MERAGLDQGGLGEILGTPQQAVSKWLSEEGTLPGGKLMIRLPAALRVSGHWLLTGELPVEPPTLAQARAFEEVSRTAVATVLQSFERTIAELRATSKLSEAERKGLEVIATRDKLVAGQANPPRRAAGGGHPKSGKR
jgi:hypothetical protein